MIESLKGSQATSFLFTILYCRCEMYKDANLIENICKGKVSNAA